MKIQIQRIGRSVDYTPNYVDNQLMEGTMKGGLRPGRELDIQFAHLGQGEWHTTKIVRIEYAGNNNYFVHTKNSIYHIRKGWRETANEKV